MGEEPADGCELHGFAGLIEIAIGEYRSARDRRGRRPAGIEVARVGARRVVAAHVRPVAAVANDRDERRRRILPVIEFGAAREAATAETRDSIGAGDAGCARDCRALDLVADLRGKDRDLRAGVGGTVAEAIDAHEAAVGKPLREYAEIRQLHEAGEVGSFRQRRIDRVGEHAGRTTELRAQGYRDRLLDVRCAGRGERNMLRRGQRKECGVVRGGIVVGDDVGRLQRNEARVRRSARHVDGRNVERDLQRCGKQVDARGRPDGRRNVGRAERCASRGPERLTERVGQRRIDRHRVIGIGRQQGGVDADR